MSDDTQSVPVALFDKDLGDYKIEWALGPDETWLARTVRADEEPTPWGKADEPPPDAVEVLLADEEDPLVPVRDAAAPPPRPITPASLIREAVTGLPDTTPLPPDVAPPLPPAGDAKRKP